MLTLFFLLRVFLSISVAKKERNAWFIVLNVIILKNGHWIFGDDSFAYLLDFRLLRLPTIIWGKFQKPTECGHFGYFSPPLTRELKLNFLVSADSTFDNIDNNISPICSITLHCAGNYLACHQKQAVAQSNISSYPSFIYVLGGFLSVKDRQTSVCAIPAATHSSISLFLFIWPRAVELQAIIVWFMVKDVGYSAEYNRLLLDSKPSKPNISHPVFLKTLIKLCTILHNVVVAYICNSLKVYYN